MQTKKIKFIGTLPPIQSAFQVHGLGDGVRIQIEIPKSDLAEAVKLLTLTGKRMKFEVCEDVDDEMI